MKKKEAIERIDELGYLADHCRLVVKKGGKPVEWTGQDIANAVLYTLGWCRSLLDDECLPENLLDPEKAMSAIVDGVMHGRGEE